MKIVVAYKWAPNPQDASVSADGTVDFARARPAVSEYDPVAIELGRRLADELGAELIGISVGGDDVASPMATKAALSRGLDALAVVADDESAHADSTRTGLLLAAVVRHLGDVDLVLCGDSSVDVGAQLVPAIMAGALGWPMLFGVQALSEKDGEWSVERSHQGGTQVLRVAGPAVFAAATDAVQPRTPGMKDILAAGKRPVNRVTLGDVAKGAPATRERLLASGRPDLVDRTRQLIDGSDPSAAADQLVAALRGAKVL